MSVASQKLENANKVEVVEVRSEKPLSKRVVDASEPISPQEGEEIIEVPPESKEENTEEPAEPSTADEDAKFSPPHDDSPQASSPVNKAGRRTREEYEGPSADTEAEAEERLPPLPLPKRTATSKSVPRVREASDETEEKPSETVNAEDVPLPSGASDVSETPSTAVNEEGEPSPKLVATESEDDTETIRQPASKRRRITDTFKGFFNRVSSAISFPLA